MKKIILCGIIIGVAMSTVAFAGQGYEVTIANYTNGAIKYESISQYSWHHNDIPWGWETIPPNTTVGPLYTEQESIFTGYICIGFETQNGTKIGTAGIATACRTSSTSIDYPKNWHNMKTFSKKINKTEFTGLILASVPEFAIDSGQYPGQPVIFETGDASANPYTVNVSIS